MSEVHVPRTGPVRGRTQGSATEPDRLPDRGPSKRWFRVHAANRALSRRTRRRPSRLRRSDRGSASVWTLAVAVVVLCVGCAAMDLAAAVSARHRAEAAADLAAIAGAAAVGAGRDGCAAAARVAAANQAQVSTCVVASDASVTVAVTVLLPPALRRLVAREGAHGLARAGP